MYLCEFTTVKLLVEKLKKLSKSAKTVKVNRMTVKIGKLSRKVIKDGSKYCKFTPLYQFYCRLPNCTVFGQFLQNVKSVFTKHLPKLRTKNGKNNLPFTNFYRMH